MPVRTWIGTADTGNFAATTNWAPTGALAADDDYLFNERGGAVDVTSGLDQSALNHTGQLRVEPGYRGKIGSEGTPLWISCSRVNYHADPTSDCEFHWKVDANAGANPTNLFLVENSARKDRAVTVTNASDAIGTVRLFGGRVVFLTGAVVTTLETYAVSLADLDVLFEETVTLTTCYFWGGTIQSYSALPTVHHESGRVTHLKGALTTYNLHGAGATLIWMPSDAATATAINLRSGLLDCAASGISRTITTLTAIGHARTSIIKLATGITITNYRDWRVGVDGVATGTNRNDGTLITS